MYCWIIPIVVGLICALLGYLLGRRCMYKKWNECEELHKNSCDEYQRNRSDFEDKLKAKEREIFDLRNKIKDWEKAPVAPQTTTPEFLFDAAAAYTVFGKKIKENDLTIVEGIGPKIQELFKNQGITTWKILSETPEDRLKEILTEAGDRFAIHNPSTWARQAALAYRGQWQELKDWQENLFGGVEPQP